MTENLTIGLSAERAIVVADEHTAINWGSGGVAVFSTPHMIGLMEGAAVAAVDPHLPPGQRSVGILLNVQHLAATVVGRPVRARAEVVAIDGRKVTFRVEAFDDAGKIGEGEHQRVVIELERFMQRAAARGK